MANNTEQERKIIRRNGSSPKVPPIQKFKDNTRVVDGCWIWQGHLDIHGYGRAKFMNTSTGAHRVSYLLFKGEIPKDLQIDHLCRNRACVNPEHLDAVTQQENIRRSLSADINREKGLTKEVCVNGHQYVQGSYALKHTKSGLRRRCLECDRAYSRDYQKRLRESKKPLPVTYEDGKWYVQLDDFKREIEPFSIEAEATRARLDEAIYWQTSINDEETGKARIAELKRQAEGEK